MSLKQLSILSFLFFSAVASQANNHVNDQNLSIDSLENLAGQGDISAQYELGIMYVEGNDVAKDMSKAKYYLDKVINNSNRSNFSFVDVAKIYWEMFELWKY
ncbi:SEL1-like repeat protein [Candidatus Thioglobus sp.]|jgi:Sel1 repeat.|uniref:SEL1-like repeat protein n=1 Tax=Candidatus Thioglobus sp. TaxID=2026721 RepID=UPI001762D271|nr:hypothetical protein [Candidatus Thioglobus sp.]